MKASAQYFCGVMIGVGVGFEIALNAHLGFIVISVGSLAGFLVTKFMRR